MFLLFSSQSLTVKLALLALLAGGATLTAQQGPASASSDVVTANNHFALELFRNVSAKQGENVFVSPFSISTALSMTFEGSQGNTRKQMAQVLHLDMADADRQNGFSLLLAQTAAQPGKHYILNTANSIWGQKDFHFQPAFTTAIDKFYGGGFTPVDFANDKAGSLTRINKWVEDRTAGKIVNLVHNEDVTAMTKLILTNAIYFKGDWMDKFKLDDTKDEDFFPAAGKAVRVPMMQQTGHFRYAHLNGMAAIEMPYAGGDLSMVAILPDGDMEKAVADLSPEALQTLLGRMRGQKVDVFLPRFKFENRILLESVLGGMGMPDAFSESAADFSGITGGRGLHIAHVIHQAVIEVNEKGSEAAAATAVVMDGKSVHIDLKETFRADRPFLFLIVHKSTGSILFMGRVSNPVAK